jgi:hypothetical protein
MCGEAGRGADPLGLGASGLTWRSSRFSATGRLCLLPVVTIRFLFLWQGCQDAAWSFSHASRLPGQTRQQFLSHLCPLDSLRTGPS